MVQIERESTSRLYKLKLYTASITYTVRNNKIRWILAVYPSLSRARVLLKRVGHAKTFLVCVRDKPGNNQSIQAMNELLSKTRTRRNKRMRTCCEFNSLFSCHKANRIRSERVATQSSTRVINIDVILQAKSFTGSLIYTHYIINYEIEMIHL